MAISPTKFEKLYKKSGGPYYVYDLPGIHARCRTFKKCIQIKRVSFHYALKANANEKVLKTILKSGMGADVVSLGELKRALAAGFKPSQIIFSGVGKTENELRFAIQKKIKQINIESVEELQRIAMLAKQHKKRVEIGLRINPNISAKTHPYITTGFHKNKFGIDLRSLPEVEKILSDELESLKCVGISMHIGSQIHDLKAFGDAIKKGLTLVETIKKRGWLISRFDIGGGLGIDYKKEAPHDIKNIRRYGALVTKLLKNSDLEIMLEPGRILVARFGLLVAQVQYIKKNRSRTFAILDTGSHHLIRPALYGAYHRIIPLKKRATSYVYQVVGPLCESSDFLANDRRLTELKQGDLVVIADAGAYGYTMASTYNLHPLPPEY